MQKTELSISRNRYSTQQAKDTIHLPENTSPIPFPDAVNSTRPPSTTLHEQVLALRQLLKEAATRKDLREVIQESEQLVSDAQQKGDLRQEALALLVLGKAHRHLNEYALAMQPLQKSIELWTTLQDEAGLAIALWELATLFVHRGWEEEAFPYLLRTLKLFEKAEDRFGIALVQTNLAIVYKKFGDLAQSQELLHSCLTHYEERGDKLNIALTLLNMAMNYMALEEFAQAVDYAQQGLVVVEALQDCRSAAQALSMIGNAYGKQAQKEDDFAKRQEANETALSYLERSLRLRRDIGIAHAVANTLGHKGGLLLLMERFEEAESDLIQAIDIYLNEEPGRILHRSGYCDALLRMGLLYSNTACAKHNDEQALDYLVQAQTIAEEDNTALLMVPVYEALVNLYEQMDRPYDAVSASRRLREIEKRMFNDDSNQRIRGLQVRFEVETAKRDAEISHLRTVELARALAETERLRLLAEERSRTDTLTGVENRRALDDRLAEEFDRSRRTGRPLVVALLDIDRFKSINDTFGHSIGDAALRHLTTVLKSQLRHGDHLARYGGEEFALLFPETDLTTAQGICERLRVWVAASAWKQLHPNLHQVTMSVGVCQFSGNEISIAEVLEKADQSLYQAKQGGRNRVVACL